MKTLIEYWEFIVGAVTVMGGGLGWLAKRRQRENATRTEATKAIIEAQNIIADLNLELIGKDTENAILYKGIINIHVNCKDCSQPEIDALPHHIKQKILKALGQ